MYSLSRMLCGCECLQHPECADHTLSPCRHRITIVRLGLRHDGLCEIYTFLSYRQSTVQASLRLMRRRVLMLGKNLGHHEGILP